jgi:hypothetical protein
VRAARPVDVTILVSQDGDRLYIERMTSAAGGPDLQQWGGSFLRLLSALADMPDVPVTTVAPARRTTPAVLAALD